MLAGRAQSRPMIYLTFDVRRGKKGRVTSLMDAFDDSLISARVPLRLSLIRGARFQRGPHEFSLSMLGYLGVRETCRPVISNAAVSLRRMLQMVTDRFKLRVLPCIFAFSSQCSEIKIREGGIRKH